MHRFLKTTFRAAMVMAAGWAWPLPVPAQLVEKDSFLLLVADYRTRPGFESDTNYINTLNDFAFRYNKINPDSTIGLSKEVIKLCERIGYNRGKSDALKNAGLAFNSKSDYVNALKYFAEALQTAMACGYTRGAGRVYHNSGIVYGKIGKYPESLENYFRALRMREAMGDTLGISSSINGIGTIYFMQGKFTEALAYYRRALALAQQIDFTSGIESGYANIGEVYYRQGNYGDAEKNLLEALQQTGITGNTETRAFITYILASIRLKQRDYQAAIRGFTETKRLAAEIGNREYEIRGHYGMSEADMAGSNLGSAMTHASEGIDIAERIGSGELLRDGHAILSRVFERKGDAVKALYHYKQFNLFADRINNQQTEQRAQNLAADYEYSKKEILLKAEQEKKEIAFQKKANQQRWILFSVLAALFSALVVASLIFRSRQKEKKSNLLLQRKNSEIDKQKTAVEKALAELKAAQQQLVHAEKMASLGELTAGIAHEIQNPLNFVNNFSEVNTELIDEMKGELQDGKKESIIGLADDIRNNNEKISFHGKRADSIVKGMLQHSRSSSGQKELTDLNNLVDECLRLSFHGMRAKDKSFNASTETLFDKSLAPVHVVTQEIGRVVLNLLTNAFYSVAQKRKVQGENYSPVVTASTRQIGNAVNITIRDNGNGIPQKVIDKIFQPFFTTKPAGEGTGLGLSMSYDIITKGHGGELKVDTREGEFAEFTIILPV